MTINVHCNENEEFWFNSIVWYYSLCVKSFSKWKKKLMTDWNLDPMDFKNWLISFSVSRFNCWRTTKKIECTLHWDSKFISFSLFFFLQALIKNDLQCTIYTKLLYTCCSIYDNWLLWHTNTLKYKFKIFVYSKKKMKFLKLKICYRHF